MKVEERDQLLIRLDERTRNIWRVTEKLERHNAEQNGFIVKGLIRGSTNWAWIRIIAGIGGSVILLIIGWLIYGG